MSGQWGSAAGTLTQRPSVHSAAHSSTSLATPKSADSHHMAAVESILEVSPSVSSLLNWLSH